MSLRNMFGVVPALTCMAVCAIPLSAQTNTCTTAPTSVTTFSIERVLTLQNALTTITPNVPANVLAAIAAGAQEIRSRIIYNQTAGTLTDTTFLVAPGAPNPTPLAVDITQSTIESYVMSVDRVYTSCRPTPSVLFVGLISGANSPFGNFSGSPAAVSVGYTTDTPAKLNNIVEVIAGQVVAYSATANGSITFPAVTVTPPGTANGAPTVVISPAPPANGGSIQVFSNFFALNTTGSSDPGNLPLTYTFTSDRTAAFQPGPTSPNPTIVFQAGAGDYTITLTVTNSAGLSTTRKFVITYLGPQ